MNRLPQEVELYRRLKMTNRRLEEARKLHLEMEEYNDEADKRAIKSNSQETDI